MRLPARDEAAALRRFRPWPSFVAVASIASILKPAVRPAIADSEDFMA
jgi:hypothetical protein